MQLVSSSVSTSGTLIANPYYLGWPATPICIIEPEIAAAVGLSGLGRLD